MRTFQITYKESPRYKKESFNKLLDKNYPVELVDGFFGDNFSGDDSPLQFLTRTKGVDSNYNLSLREIALSCGHMKIWRTIIEEDINMALVVEDDADPLIDHDEFVETFSKDFDGLDFSVVQLQRPHRAYNCNDDKAVFTSVDGKNYDISNPCGWGTVAYVVSNRGARELMYNTKLQPADWYIKRLSEMGNVYNPKDDFFGHMKIPSTITYDDIKSDPHEGKIFCVGNQKTGTSTLCKMLDILGVKTAHWGKHHTVLEHPDGIDWSDQNFKRFSAFADIPVPMFYKEFDEQFPNSKFILTVRDHDQWLESVEAHQKWLTNNWSKPLLSSEQFYYGVDKFDKEVFSNKYTSLNWKIIDYFKDRPNDLLVIDMTYGFQWGDICEFLGKDIPEEEIPHEMKRKS